MTTFAEKEAEPLKSSKPKEQWGNDIEFLFSCISLSVGLGNIWRFPYIAFQNGGGAFVIPYLIVLLIIGRPVYYLEIIIGQFSGKGCIKAMEMAPVMKGKIFYTLKTLNNILCLTARCCRGSSSGHCCLHNILFQYNGADITLSYSFIFQSFTMELLSYRMGLRVFRS